VTDDPTQRPIGGSELRTLAIALLVSLVLWNLPFAGILLYPFKLLATWLHEMSHGLVMILTGNGLDRVTIYRDTSGLANAQEHAGPTALVFIASAGYMGTPLWGAALLVATPTGRAARNALLILAAALGISALLVVAAPDGDRFGQIAVAAMAAVAGAIAIAVPVRWRLALAHFIAAQSCVNALLDIRILMRPHQVVNGLEIPARSDAHAMAVATFGTDAQWAAWFWATAWLLWSLAILFFALRLTAARQRTLLPAQE
jgi:hypothetical protein